jgi:hypothetical protein
MNSEESFKRLLIRTAILEEHIDAELQDACDDCLQFKCHQCEIRLAHELHPVRKRDLAFRMMLIEEEYKRRGLDV